MTDRKNGIGGTDISAIVGMNPFKTLLDVFLDKTGQSEETPDNENMYWGRAMEPLLAKRYHKETGTKLYIPKVKELPFHDSERQWIIGSPDALTSFHQPEGGVDFKTSGKPQEWGEPGTDEVPQHYIIQAEWYMGLTGAQWWDIAVLLMGFARRFAIYRINRDDELICDLTDAGERFWKDHVLAGVAPALDGSKSAAEYIKRKYPTDLGPMLEPTNAEILADLDRYREVSGQLKHLESVESMYENRLKAFVADFSGMQGPWGKITWKKSKDAEIINWQGIVAELNPPTDLINRHKSIRPGSRRWLPKFNQED